MKKRKKIAFVVGKLSSGGSERVISTLANSLIGRYDITIIPFVNREPFYRLDSEIEIVPCKESISTPKSIFHSLGLNIQLIWDLSKTLRRQKVDVAIGFITSANILTIIATKIVGIPCIISERNNPMREYLPKFWILLRNLFYPRANYIVLQTNGIRDFYRNEIKASKMVILPNPIARELSERTLFQKKKENIVLTVGRLDINKCHKLIINAFNSIPNEGWKLLIVGEGDERSNLIQHISALGLQEKVKLIPATKDISDYYASAQVFAFASRTEGFPNALLEAMHFGLPCVSTNCPFGPADLIEHESNGFLVPVDDLEEFTTQLKVLMEDGNLRSQMGENAKSSSDQFRVEVVVQKWAQLIEKVI